MKNTLFSGFPVYKQLATNDCGPTCLRIVAKYYKQFHNIEYLKNICHQNSDGVTLYNLRKGAEILGFQASVVNVDVSKFNSIDKPFIAYLKNKHYVVVYRCSKDSVFVSDPRIGLNTYSRSEFHNLWANEDGLGKLLLLRDNQGRRNIGNQKTNSITLFSTLLRHIKPYKKAVSQIFVTMVITLLVTFMIPFITKSIVDVGVVNKDSNFLLLLCIAQAAFFSFSIIADWVKTEVAFHIGSRVKINIINEYLVSILQLPINFFQQKRIGDIIQRAKDQERVQNFITSTALTFPASCLLVLIYGGILLSYNGTLALIFIASTLLYIGWVVMFYNARKKTSIKFYELTGHNQSHLVEISNTIEDVKNYNLYSYYMNKWEKNEGQLHSVKEKLLRVDNLQRMGGSLINSLRNISITYYAAYLTINGSITLGELLAIQFILGTIQGPVFELINFIKDYQYTFISFSRVNEIYNLNSERELYNNPGVNENYLSNDLIPPSMHIRLVDACYKYNGAEKLSLKNLNISIRPRQMTAIVGISGSGKSTLLKVIQRMIPLSSGKFYYGDINTRDIYLDTWRENISTIDQESMLIHDTVMNNVVLGEELDMVRLTEVLKDVSIYHELEQMPGGIHTLIAENGKGLSSGQKQRILFARSLYKKSNILIYDEATNALDSINERRILDTIKEKYSQRTMIIASHKLSTIKYANYIIVVQDGFVVETGTYGELMNKGGFFSQMFGEISNVKSIVQADHGI